MTHADLRPEESPYRNSPHAGRQGAYRLADLIALVRHAIDPSLPIVSFSATLEERYGEWLTAQQSSGIRFSADQLRWLDAIKDHIAASLIIEQDDFEYLRSRS